MSYGKLGLVTAAMAAACLSVPSESGGYYSRPKGVSKDERERRKKAKKLAQKMRKRNR